MHTCGRPSARAADPVLEGIVKDPKGHPIEGADIRIETKNGGRLLTTVKTDVNGRYILDGLPAGNYRITLVVHGAVKTSINNTTIESGAPTRLNFDLRAPPASRASVTAKKGRHWVWGCVLAVDSNGRTSGLLTRIATTESVSLRIRMKT